jgi:hypothetical protein
MILNLSKAPRELNSACEKKNNFLHRQLSCLRVVRAIESEPGFIQSQHAIYDLLTESVHHETDNRLAPQITINLPIDYFHGASTCSILKD